MSQLTKIHLRNIPIAAFLQLFKSIVALLIAAGPFLRNMVTAARINKLQDLVTRMEARLLWPGVTALTKKIAEANRRLDHAISELIMKVRSLVKFGDTPAAIETAERVEAMLKHYGDAKRKPYDDETGTVELVLTNLNGPYAADVAALGIGALKDALQAALDSFKALLKERETAEGTKPKDTVEDLKKDIGGLYLETEEIINSGAALKLSQEFEQLINLVNPEIEHFNREFDKGRSSLKTAQIAPIADQPFTGGPSTPPPKVYYETADGTIPLELGKHYNVTYDKNIDVGQAKCTIHGKGKYKDSQTVTFTIKRGPIDAAANAAAEEEFRRALLAKAEAAKAAKAAKAGMVAKGEGI
jgi:hypothetical protein